MHKPENFWSKVTKTETCWLWTGRVNAHQYGALSYQTRKWLAHRLAYVLTRGPIPKDKCVLHSCDVRNCCNPDHLWIGTDTDNAADKIAKGRQYKVISDETITSIRERYAGGGISQRGLAAEYRINFSTVKDILHFRIRRLL